ncbi:DoxX family protein [Dongshaea marina]|uniref:DoxX family protein n=1 Tax=Dongshaea marina TaxID=2047966 RepID=UPI000D3EA274|nr:DoxX family protein [Dongshaea marina]
MDRINRLLSHEDLAKLILRLSLAVLLLFHGVSKILHPQILAFVEAQVAAAGLPHITSYGVFVGELLAPLLLIFGIYSRVAGLLVVVNMLFALMLVHFTQFMMLGDSGGWKLELQMFYLISGLLVLLLGSGNYALKGD